MASLMIKFSRGLENDFEAVKVGLSLPFSNGQLEGQINRVKNLSGRCMGGLASSF